MFEPVFRYVWSNFEAFCTKNEDFDQIYLNTGLKTQNVEKLSLDSIIFVGKIVIVLVSELQVYNSH